jgi:LPS-assembly lipoprotein
MTELRILILVGLLLVQSGCGFHLRGSASLPYHSIFIEAPATSVLGPLIRRAIKTRTQTQLADNPKVADALFTLISEQRQKVILSLSTGGRVREYQLIYRLSYRLTDKENKTLRPDTIINLHRNFSFNDQDVLSKESEEALLYRDMQNDAVAQLMRQLEKTPDLSHE